MPEHALFVHLHEKSGAMLGFACERLSCKGLLRSYESILLLKVKTWHLPLQIECLPLHGKEK